MRGILFRMRNICFGLYLPTSPRLASLFLMKRLIPKLALLAMTVTAAAITFDEWRAAHFTAEELNLTVSSEGADPDGDGKTNLLEFATNTNPKGAGNGTGWTTAFDSGGHLTLGFTRWKSYSGLLYAPQVSSDLLGLWKSGLPDVAELAATSNGTDTDWVAVRDSTALGSAGRRFIRLFVAVDADDDGLPDDWEIAVFGNIESQSGSGDFDLDSLSNLIEWQKGTDARDYYNGQLPTLTIVSGNQQNVPPDAFAPAPLVVEVRNSSGALLHNATVSFALSQGTGWLASVENDSAKGYLDALTDSQGRAQVRFHTTLIGGTTTIDTFAYSGEQVAWVTFAETTVTRAERPDGLGYSVNADASVEFTWADYSDDETSFVLEGSANRGGTWQQIGTAAEGAQSLTVSGVDPSGMVFRIAAVNIAGRSGNTLDATYGAADDDEDGLCNQDEEDEGTGKDNPDSDGDDVPDGDDGAPLDADLSPQRLPKLPFAIIDLTELGLSALYFPIEINDRGHIRGSHVEFDWQKDASWGRDFFHADGATVEFLWPSYNRGQGHLTDNDWILGPRSGVSGGPWYFKVWKPEEGILEVPVNLAGFGDASQYNMYPISMANDGVIVGHAFGFVNELDPEHARTIWGTHATPASDFGNNVNWWVEAPWFSSNFVGEDREAYGMNNRHDIVGTTAETPGRGDNARPFAYVGGQFYDLPGWTHPDAAWLINNPNADDHLPDPTILGERMWVKTPTGWLAKDMPGIPVALNDRLEIIGDFLTADGARNYYRNGEWLDLSSHRLSGGAWQFITPDTFRSPADINNHGLIAGRAYRKDDPNKVEKPVLLLPVEMRITDRDDPKKKWADNVVKTALVYSGKSTGDMVSWKLGGSDSWTSATFSWSAEGPETKTGPSGTGKNEWKIADGDEDTAKDWLDWKPGKYKIKCAMSFAGGSSSTAEFEQEVGERTEQYFVAGTIPFETEDTTGVLPRVVTQWECPNIFYTLGAVGGGGINSTQSNLFVPMDVPNRVYVNNRMLNSTRNFDPKPAIKPDQPLAAACGLDDHKHHRFFSGCQFKFRIKDDKLAFDPEFVKDNKADIVGFTPAPCSQSNAAGVVGEKSSDSGKVTGKAGDAVFSYLTKNRVGPAGQAGWKTVNGRVIPWVFFRFRFEAKDDGLIDTRFDAGPSSDPNGPDSGKDYSSVPTILVYRRYYDLQSSQWKAELVRELGEQRRPFMSIGTPVSGAPYVIP